MTSMVEAVRYARRPIELNARPGDTVLIVTDLGMPRDVVDALFAGAHSLGHEVSIAEFTPRATHGLEPPDTVARAMAAADIALLATSTATAHTLATTRAIEHGTRCVFMEEVTLDMLCHGAATADYDQVARLAAALQSKWNDGKYVKVTSSFGTDLEANIEGRRSWPLAGRSFSEPWFALQGCCAFPDGECGIAPVEGTANGTVVFDTTVHTVGLLEDPVRLEVADSKVVSISGGRQADKLRQDLEEHGDENSYYCPAEIAIGINEAARVTGLLREDKKLLGSCHIAYGTNSDIGGTVKARMHIDGLMRQPTIEIDGEAVVREGMIQVAY